MIQNIKNKKVREKEEEENNTLKCILIAISLKCSYIFKKDKQITLIMSLPD